MTTNPTRSRPSATVYIFFSFFLTTSFWDGCEACADLPPPSTVLYFVCAPAGSFSRRKIQTRADGRTDGRTMNVTDSLPQLVCGEEYQSIEGKKRGSVQSGKHSTPDNNKKTKPKNNNSRNKSGLISSLIVTFGNKKTNFWFSFFLGQTNK